MRRELAHRTYVVVDKTVETEVDEMRRDRARLARLRPAAPTSTTVHLRNPSAFGTDERCMGCTTTEQRRSFGASSSGTEKDALAVAVKPEDRRT
jgi:hypothetical protein